MSDHDHDHDINGTDSYHVTQHTQNSDHHVYQQTANGP